MRVKEKMTGLFALPKEIALNLPLLTLTGHNEINIENYKNLIEFTESIIRVQTNAGMLHIEGHSLTLKQVTSEHLLITGKIKAVSWLG